MTENKKNRSDFFDLKVGDVALAYDEYSREADIHHVKITSIEYDKENVCEENPEGMTCYGEDLEKEKWGDDYVTVVTPSNFAGIPLGSVWISQQDDKRVLSFMSEGSNKPDWHLAPELSEKFIQAMEIYLGCSYSFPEGN